ncbi:DUF5959 family protein [Streptomyces sp. NPDC005728]|uniref:DUF5959 family protein n=1 Tax=Streptomyces sp. NPDC005728 TaxID=3157054 RepID=UPI0033D3C340
MTQSRCDCRFRDPKRRFHRGPGCAAVDAPAAIEEQLGQPLPESLRELLTETDGFPPVARESHSAGPGREFVQQRQLSLGRACRVDAFGGGPVPAHGRVSVRVPIALPDDWVADHRQRLHQVMNHWVPMLSA